MKCPLLCIARPTEIDHTGLTEADCLKEKCAWWNEYYGMCSQAIDGYLKGIADYRLEIKQSMQDRY